MVCRRRTVPAGAHRPRPLVRCTRAQAGEPLDQEEDFAVERLCSWLSRVEASSGGEEVPGNLEHLLDESQRAYLLSFRARSDSARRQYILVREEGVLLCEWCGGARRGSMGVCVLWDVHAATRGPAPAGAAPLASKPAKNAQTVAAHGLLAMRCCQAAAA